MRSVTIEFPDHNVSYAGEVADSMATRSKGLLGRASLSSGDALLIEPCNSVHTSFMRFAIDVIYLDAEDNVLKVIRKMKPFRFSWGGLSAKRVVELASGAAPSKLVPGDKVRIETNGVH
jgi:uncharacterized protein